MRIKTVTTVTALNSAGQLVEALPVRTAVAGETDIVGRLVTPINVTEDPQGVPVRFVTGKSAVNSAGQVVDSIPVSGGVVPANKLRLVGTLNSPNTTGEAMTAGNERRESRAPLFLPNVATTEIWTVYGTWWTNIGAGGGEAALGNAMAVADALEVGGTTVQAPNASVASPATVPDNSNFLAGPKKAADFGLPNFAPNAAVFTRSSAEVAIGKNLPRSGMYLSEAPASRRQHAAADASEVGGTGAMVTGTAGNTISPIAVLADIGDSAIKAGIGYGNSVLMADGDGQPYPSASDGGGWATRSTKSGGVYDKPLTKFGRSGATLASFVLSGRYERRLEMLLYADFALLVFGHNDLFEVGGVGTTAYNTFLANMLTLFARIRAIKNLPIIATTISPRTKSNNNFVDAAGQSVQDNWVPANIQQYNRTQLPTWLADGTIQGIFDHAADCERPDNPALWQDNRTGDGTHGNTATHIAASTRFRNLRTSMGL